MVKREDDVKYNEQMGFMISSEVRKALEKYSAEEGIKPAVVIRKSLVKYLKEKGVLDKEKLYL